MGLRDTSSQPPFSISFFGAVLYLFLFHPWGFPLLITRKGATSSDVLFITTQSRRGQSALRGIASCSLGLNTFGQIRDPSEWQASCHSGGKDGQGEGAICQNSTVVGPASYHADLSRPPALDSSEQNIRAGGTCKSLQSSLPIHRTGEFHLPPHQGVLIRATHGQSSKKKQDVNCRMNPKDFLARSNDARQYNAQVLTERTCSSV